MLTATGTIVFLLIASALVSLAIHIMLADAETKRTNALSQSLRSARTDSGRLLELERAVAMLGAQPHDDSHVPLLERRLKQVGQKLFEVDGRLDGIDARFTQLSAMGSASAEVDRMQKSLYAQDMRLCTLEENVQRTIARTDEVVTQMDARDEAAREASVKVSEAEGRDLTRIKGIGSVLAKSLNDAGITSIDQVANLSIDQIEDLSQQLGKFGDRVERDRWVEQARELTGIEA